MTNGLNGHGAMFLLGSLNEAVEFIKVGMAEQRSEVRHELAAVREDLGNLRATVEAMSRPSTLASTLKLLGSWSGTQWRWFGTAVLFLTAEARSDLDLQGHKGRAQLTWSQLASWIAFFTAFAFVAEYFC